MNLQSSSQRSPRLSPLTLCAALALWGAMAGAAFGQSYPAKPIRLIIPFPAGGTTDIVGRLVADRMGRELGHSVIVENRGGGGGAIGANEVAQSAPDGYIIGMGTVSTMAVNPACNPKLPYNPLRDFEPITNLAIVANVIAVHPSVPAKDFKEFLALLKAQPGKQSYASSGTCGIGHMIGEQFKVASGTFMLHIPYRGAGPALNDVVAGQVPVIVDNLPSSMPHILSGKLRALVVAWPKRIDQLPNVPTFVEVGLKEVNDPAWYGLVAPAKTPEAITTRLRDAAVKAMQDRELQERFRANGAEPLGNTPAEYTAQIKREYEKAVDVVKRQGIKLE